MTRREVLTWVDVSQWIDHLLAQIDQPYHTLLMITPSGLLPGGLIATGAKIPQVFTARVEFASVETNQYSPRTTLLALPTFLDFPPAQKLIGQLTLVVDASWGCGRIITSVQKRVESYGGVAKTAVLHFNPHKNMLESIVPDYYAAITDAEIIYPWEVGFGDKSNLFPKTR